MLRLISSIIFYKIYDSAMWPMQNIVTCSVSVGCTATCGSLERIHEWMNEWMNKTGMNESASFSSQLFGW
jgi:hypothetical protein